MFWPPTQRMSEHNPRFPQTPFFPRINDERSRNVIDQRPRWCRNQIRYALCYLKGQTWDIGWRRLRIGPDYPPQISETFQVRSRNPYCWLTSKFAPCSKTVSFRKNGSTYVIMWCSSPPHFLLSNDQLRGLWFEASRQKHPLRYKWDTIEYTIQRACLLWESLKLIISARVGFQNSRRKLIGIIAGLNFNYV